MQKQLWILGIGLLWAGLNVTAQEETAGRLVCEETTHDFGQADTGTSIQHTFVLRNEGAQAVEITRVHPGCGCTAAELPDKVVLPGGEVGLSTTLNLAGRRGLQKKYVLVETDSPLTPSLTLWLQVLAYEPMQVSAETLYFGMLGANPEQVRSVTLKGGTGEPLHVTGVETDSELLAVETEVVREGVEYTVQVATRAEAASVESEEALVRILTDLEDRPEVEVKVHLDGGLGEVMVAPEAITLSPGNEPVTRQVLVGAPGIDAFVIKMVHTPHPDIRFMISKLKPNSYRVQLKNIVPAAALDGAVVRIVTDLEGYEEIEVPLVVEAE